MVLNSITAFSNMVSLQGRGQLLAPPKPHSIDNVMANQLLQQLLACRARSHVRQWPKHTHGGSVWVHVLAVKACLAPHVEPSIQQIQRQRCCQVQPISHILTRHWGNCIDCLQVLLDLLLSESRVSTPSEASSPCMICTDEMSTRISPAVYARTAKGANMQESKLQSRQATQQTPLTVLLLGRNVQTGLAQCARGSKFVSEGACARWLVVETSPNNGGGAIGDALE